MFMGTIKWYITDRFGNYTLTKHHIILNADYTIDISKEQYEKLHTLSCADDKQVYETECSKIFSKEGKDKEFSPYKFKAFAEDLQAKGYQIDNSKITHVSLTMEDHGCLTSWISLEGGCNVNYGGYCLGNGYLGSDNFTGSAETVEYLMQLMDTVGVSRWEDLKGEYVRVAHHGLGSTVDIIGNIIENKWFDQRAFFKQKQRKED